jgi:hypothetical protein
MSRFLARRVTGECKALVCANRMFEDVVSLELERWRRKEAQTREGAPS